MKRTRDRHYIEEELLVHMLGESSPELAAAIDEHVRTCSECAAVLGQHRELLRLAREWRVPEPGPGRWEAQKAQLLELYRRARREPRGTSPSSWLWSALKLGWEYALDNPLPTLGYIAAVVAFASERTITLFQLDRILPATAELLEILRQAF